MLEIRNLVICRCSEGLLLRRSAAAKIGYTEGPLSRRSSVPKVWCLENEYSLVLLPRIVKCVVKNIKHKRSIIHCFRLLLSALRRHSFKRRLVLIVFELKNLAFLTMGRGGFVS